MSITQEDIGRRGTQIAEVVQTMTAAAHGNPGLDVLATPALIGLVERAAMESVRGRLGPDELTVGSEAHIAHLAPTPVGATVTVVANIAVVDRRRIVFDVEASDGGAVILRGTQRVSSSMDRGFARSSPARPENDQPVACCRFERLDIPIIARICGGAYGGGLFLACYADHSVVQDQAVLVAPEVAHGWLPPGGCEELIQIVGLQRAKEIILTALPGAKSSIVCSSTNFGLR